MNAVRLPWDTINVLGSDERTDKVRSGFHDQRASDAIK